jgi:hypothetical protein
MPRDTLIHGADDLIRTIQKEVREGSRAEDAEIAELERKLEKLKQIKEEHNRLSEGS